MGYLNSDTVVVDAILTKHGRWKLSRPGGQLGIERFAVSDDFIDYRLFNPQHSSGSLFFGEEIEKLPMVEAIPTDENCMKYKLSMFDFNLPQNRIAKKPTENREDAKLIEQYKLKQN